jgi:hypothetical protein
MTTDRDLDWWVAKSAVDWLPGVPSRFERVGEGWERVVDLARDAAAHPHQSSSADRLKLECREMADLLVQIVTEYGHTLTLAECLRTIIVDVASRPIREEADRG